MKASEKSTHTKVSDGKTSDLILKTITEVLDENKAVDIEVIDLSGKTSIADYMVVASGSSKRQVGALTDYVTRKLKEDGHGSCRVEGLTQGDWVLIDAGDVIAHIFRPEVRDFYSLEKMWSVVPGEDSAVS